MMPSRIVSTMKIAFKSLLPLTALIVLTGCSDSGSTDSTVSSSSGSGTAGASSDSSDSGTTSDTTTTDDADSQPPAPGLPTAELQAHDAGAARMMAERFATDEISKDQIPPPQAVFQPDEPVVDLGAGIYKVSGYVDTRNTSGKLSRFDFEVRLNWESGDEWRCDYIKVKPHK